MFQVIAVDDESASLRRLERLLANHPSIDAYRLFDSSEEALHFAEKNEISLAILDVEMPVMNGMALATKLREKFPAMEILFVTAYSQYALDAFSVHASGYLLKPISSADFNRELELILARHGKKTVTSDNGKLVVNCFGAFSCHAGGSDQMIRFRTVKSEELFLLLLDSKNGLRSKDYLLEALWPGVEYPERTGNNFRVTCSYLRKAFSGAGLPEILLRSKEDYYLDLDKIDCDLFAFRDAIDNYSTMSLEELKQVTALYKGPYLENKIYDWACESRSWLENRSQLWELNPTTATQ